MKLLFDTSVLIDYFRRKVKTDSLLYQLILKEHSLFISIITYAELYAGKGVWEHKEAKEEIETLLLHINTVQIEKLIAQRAGAIRARYGNNLLDALIAATAIQHDLDLVTLNRKDFETIAELKLFTE